jgi:hypothetical protein
MARSGSKIDIGKTFKRVLKRTRSPGGKYTRRDHLWKKGRPKTGGRKKGVPNIITRELKEAIIKAAELQGRDAKGKDSLVGYLYRLAAEKEPMLFVSLLRTVLPMQNNLDAQKAGGYESVEEVRKELRAAGLPDHAIYRLEHGDKVVEAEIMRDCEPTMRDKRPTEAGV